MKSPALRKVAARLVGPHLAPQPLRRPGLGVHEAGHPLVPAATGIPFHEAQRVLEHASRGGLAAPESERDAGFDLVGLPRHRLQMGAEDVEHARRIPRELELWEIGVDGRRFWGDRHVGEHSVGHGEGAR